MPSSSTPSPPSPSDAVVRTGIGILFLLIQSLRKRKHYHTSLSTNPLASPSLAGPLEELRSLLIKSLTIYDDDENEHRKETRNKGTRDTEPSTIATNPTDNTPSLRCCPWVYKAEGAANITFTYNPLSLASISSTKNFDENRNNDDKEWSLFQGLILRVKKVASTHHSHPPNAFPSTSLPMEGECTRSSSSSLSSTSSPTSCTLFPSDALTFAHTVMRPLLGNEYIIPGISIPVTTACLRTLRHLLDNAVQDRPSKRRNDRIDETYLSIVIMLDHTLLDGLSNHYHYHPDSTRIKNNTIVFPSFVSGVPRFVPSVPSSLSSFSLPFSFPTLCIEIKPKAGIVPVCYSGSVYSPLYNYACRFCMHQISKGFEYRAKELSKHSDKAPPSSSSSNPSFCRYCQQHPKFSVTNQLCYHCLETLRKALSHYCPMDLYSSDTERIYHTLDGLVGNPQNNLRIFENGRTVFTAESVHQRSPTIKPVDSTVETNILHSYFPWFESYLSTCYTDQNEIVSSSSLSSTRSTPTTTNILLRILTQILVKDSVRQKLRNVQALSTLSGNIEEVYRMYRNVEELLQRTNSALSIEEYLAKHPSSNETITIRDFLIAQTAKDVSLLIAVQIFPMDKEDTEEEESLALNHNHRPPSRTTLSAPSSSSVSSLMNPTGLLLDIEHMQRNLNTVYYRSSDQRIRLRIAYSIAIVDVDKKSVHKIPYYYEQEQSILDCFRSYGSEIFTYSHKECGVRHRKREEEEEELTCG